MADFGLTRVLSEENEYTGTRDKLEWCPNVGTGTNSANVLCVLKGHSRRNSDFDPDRDKLDKIPTLTRGTDKLYYYVI